MTKSLDAHLLEGTYRPDRHRPGHLASVEVVVPSNLTPEQSNLFLDLADGLEVDLIDVATIEAAVIQISRAREAREIIEREGITTTINNSATLCVHPAVRIERDAQVLALKLLDRIRSKHAVVQKPTTVTKGSVGRSPRMKDTE